MRQPRPQDQPQHESPRRQGHDGGDEDQPHAIDQRLHRQPRGLRPFDQRDEPRQDRVLPRCPHAVGQRRQAFTVPPVTLSPGAFEAEIGSPVSIDSSTGAELSVNTPSNTNGSKH